MDQNLKVVRLGLVGPTNAGKSTLLNSLVKKKVSIVSHKVQTTRSPVEACYDIGDYRVVFTDTPGYIDKEYNDNINNFISKSIYSVSLSADILVGVFDVRRMIREDDYENYFLKFYNQSLEYSGQKLSFLVLNKVDSINNKFLLEVLARVSKDIGSEVSVIPLSSLKSKGADYLVGQLVEIFDKHESLLRYDYKSEDNMIFYASELVREGVYKFLHEELPYDIGVQIVVLNRSAKLVKIVANIVVDRNAQKGIVVGKQGASIKRIGSYARAELKKAWGRNVHLDLKVKVINNWKSKQGVFNSMLKGEV